MPTEVRILRSSSTNAIIAIFLFIRCYSCRPPLWMKLEQIVANRKEVPHDK
jgi:hypothetical protein